MIYVSQGLGDKSTLNGLNGQIKNNVRGIPVRLIKLEGNLLVSHGYHVELQNPSPDQTKISSLES